MATLGGGCVWGLQDAFRKVPGVVSVLTGYTGGYVDGPMYEQVCAGTTGQAEAVQIAFDPRRVSYTRLLDLIFRLHYPAQPDGQEPDTGLQYRSAIFYHNERQKAEAERAVAGLDATSGFSGSVVIAIEPAGPFRPAGEYHQ